MHRSVTKLKVTQRRIKEKREWVNATYCKRKISEAHEDPTLSLSSLFALILPRASRVNGFPLLAQICIGVWPLFDEFIRE